MSTPYNEKITESLKNLSNLAEKTTYRTTSEDCAEQIISNQRTCSELIPTSFIENPKNTQKKPKNYDKMKHIKLGMKKDLMQENVDGEKLKKMALVLSDNIGTVSFMDADGIQRFMTTQTKGTQRYNKKYGFKIENAIIKFVKLDDETFGLTLTCDPKLYNRHPILAWEHFKEDMDELFRVLRENMGAKMVVVMESTLKGYPHAHIMLAFPKGTIKGYGKLPSRKSLKYGELVKIIKKHIKHPIFNLQKVNGEKLGNYMAKYFKKMANVSLRKCAAKKEPLTKEETKVLLCYVMTSVAGVRQFELPRERKKSEKSKKNDKQLLADLLLNSKNPSKYFDFLPPEELPQDQEMRAKYFARSRAYLISLCNNSRCFFQSPIFLMSIRNYEINFQVPLEKMQYAPKEEQEKYKKMAHCITCGGCVYSHVAKLLKYGHDEWLDKALWIAGGRCELAFSEAIKQNDEQFVIRLAQYIDYLNHTLHLANCKPSEFFNSEWKQKATWARQEMLGNARSDEERTAIYKATDQELLDLVEKQGDFICL